jgi:hypothetical protein
MGNYKGAENRREKSRDICAVMGFLLKMDPRDQMARPFSSKFNISRPKKTSFIQVITLATRMGFGHPGPGLRNKKTKGEKLIQTDKTSKKITKMDFFEKKAYSIIHFLFNEIFMKIEINETEKYRTINSHKLHFFAFT